MQAYQQYQQRNIETASPEEVLILLYDGLIRFLNRSRRAMETKDVAKAHEQLIRAQHIVLELMTSLDMKADAAMAKPLYALYEYLHHTLIQANVKQDISLVEEVLRHVRDLKATWEEAIKQVRQERVAEGLDESQVKGSSTGTSVSG